MKKESPDDRPRSRKRKKLGYRRKSEFDYLDERIHQNTEFNRWERNNEAFIDDMGIDV